MTNPRDSLLPVYSPPEMLLVRGEGTEVIDDTGTRYLDFTSGIGVNALGHGHPAVVDAIHEVVAKGLLHASNLFRTGPAENLARRLAELSGLERAFFCNSGAESVEGAIKFARKWARSQGGGAKHRIVAFRGSFHGRLFGSLAVTDRPDFQRAFEPLMPGVDFVDAGDMAALDKALDTTRTAAVIVEPIQGEVGIRPLSPDVLFRLREWTEERRIALILDEIQCGLGRTGTLFAFESIGIRPDLLCLAKPLAGGLPMGAVLASDAVGSVMQPGDHGTTFGGSPLAASVALAVLGVLSDVDFLGEVRRKGAVLESLLTQLRTDEDGRVRDVRGRGLLWGIELTDEARPVVARAREHGLLTVPAGSHVVRLLPPLTVSDDEIRKAVSILEASLG